MARSVRAAGSGSRFEAVAEDRIRQGRHDLDMEAATQGVGRARGDTGGVGLTDRAVHGVGRAVRATRTRIDGLPGDLEARARGLRVHGDRAAREDGDEHPVDDSGAHGGAPMPAVAAVSPIPTQKPRGRDHAGAGGRTGVPIPFGSGWPLAVLRVPRSMGWHGFGRRRRAGTSGLRVIHGRFLPFVERPSRDSRPTRRSIPKVRDAADGPDGALLAFCCSGRGLAPQQSSPTTTIPRRPHAHPPAPKQPADRRSQHLRLSECGGYGTVPRGTCGSGRWPS